MVLPSCFPAFMFSCLNRLRSFVRDPAITDCMLLIPYPYTRVDAAGWVRHCLEQARTQPHATELAIRRPDGFLVGAIGVLRHTGKGAHRGELGYWLAEAYRGRGLMTRAVRAVVAYGFGTLGLRRIEATAFVHNPASQRVLERAGLVREGTLAGWHVKGGRLIDACMFAIVAPPPSANRLFFHGPLFPPPARRGSRCAHPRLHPPAARRRCAPGAAGQPIADRGAADGRRGHLRLPLRGREQEGDRHQRAGRAARRRADGGLQLHL